MALIKQTECTFAIGPPCSMANELVTQNVDILGGRPADRGSGGGRAGAPVHAVLPGRANDVAEPSQHKSK